MDKNNAEYSEMLFFRYSQIHGVGKAGENRNNNWNNILRRTTRWRDSRVLRDSLQEGLCRAKKYLGEAGTPEKRDWRGNYSVSDTNSTRKRLPLREGVLYSYVYKTISKMRSRNHEEIQELYNRGNKV